MFVYTTFKCECIASVFMSYQLKSKNQRHLHKKKLKRHVSLEQQNVRGVQVGVAPGAPRSGSVFAFIKGYYYSVKTLQMHTSYQYNVVWEQDQGAVYTSLVPRLFFPSACEKQSGHETRAVQNLIRFSETVQWECNGLRLTVTVDHTARKIALCQEYILHLRIHNTVHVHIQKTGLSIQET